MMSWPGQGPTIGRAAGGLLLPGSANNAYDDLQEAALALPSGASGEILFDIYRVCAEPGGPAPGMIIDNLRIE
jgi:hypothetical protein